MVGKPESIFLVVNPGSSSEKYALYHDQEEVFSAKYEIRDNADGCLFCLFEWSDGKVVTKRLAMPLEASFDNVREVLSESGLVTDEHPIDAILVRLVATGEYFAESRFVDANMMMELERIEKINTLHVPPAMEAIEHAREAFGETPIIVMSDSETLVKRSRKDLNYALAPMVEEFIGVVPKRYGAHGNSHGYIIARMRELRLPEAMGKVIVCHLGSGCSITAFEYGDPIYHSMGFTPLEGLMSSTRTGSIDPTIGALLGDCFGATAAIELMNKKSGLLALTGSKDMQCIVERCIEGDPEAMAAAEDFVSGVAGTIGKYATLMKGVDAVVFTATIGERSAWIRQAIVDYLGQFGFHSSEKPDAKLDFPLGYANIARPSSKPLYVIPTNEAAYMIMRAKEMLR